MRKQWVKKESLYHKPFYKQKLKMTMLAVLLLGVVFLAYQVFSVNQLQLLGRTTSGAAHDTTSYAHAQESQMQLGKEGRIDVAAGGGSNSSSKLGVAAVDGTADKIVNVQPTAAERAAMLADRRGIRDRDLARYEPTLAGTFRCVRSGEVLRAEKVNDDYCDCADGSDEPATNACPMGRFYCAHRTRHPRAGIDRQQSIASSRINDGVCDCCDGSDEWLPQRRLAIGQVPKCPQRCDSV